MAGEEFIVSDPIIHFWWVCPMSIEALDSKLYYEAPGFPQIGWNPTLRELGLSIGKEAMVLVVFDNHTKAEEAGHTWPRFFTERRTK